MAFELKKKLQEGKNAASGAFKKAVEKGSEVAQTVGQKANELNDKIEAGTNKFVTKVEEKVLSFRRKKPEPKQDAPKQG